MTTTAIQYQVFTNMSTNFGRTYERGDTLVPGCKAHVEVSTDGPDPSKAFSVAAELVFMMHNEDGRPDGLTAPSLSVGDVIVFAGEFAYSVDSVGFATVDVNPDDVAWDKTYLQFIGVEL